jgi:hypothetical protein
MRMLCLRIKAEHTRKEVNFLNNFKFRYFKNEKFQKIVIDAN